MCGDNVKGQALSTCLSAIQIFTVVHLGEPLKLQAFGKGYCLCLDVN